MNDIDQQATIASLFRQRIAASGEHTALHIKRGGKFQPLTWRQIADDVARAAATLKQRGVQAGDRVAQVSGNRYEWIVADLAIHCLRAVHVPIHCTLSGPQITWQIADCQARAVLLADQQQADKLAGRSGELSPEIAWLSYDEASLGEGGPRVALWQQALDAIELTSARSQLEQTAREVQPDDLATILYTSGTTGEPKGVMLSQRNLASNALATLEAFGQQPNDVRLTWLPLSHIFARTCDFYTWVACGCELALSDNPQSVVADCAQIHPTLLNGVPYFFEKVQRSLMESGKADVPGALQYVFGGKLRAGCAGGAPLPDHVAEFYRQRGVLLLQGYGLTESSPVICTCTAAANKLGTVGPAIPGVEVKIADDGEILTRGPHVMLGYWKRPDDTAAVLQDGWLYTGDIGQLDADGFLKITGRKKEIIVTSGGKNIAPAYLEALLTADPLIQQAVVIGDRRSFLAALIVPDLAALKQHLAEFGLSDAPLATALGDERVKRLYQQHIEERLAEVSQYEQVCRFTLLEQPLSAESGELTLTLKLRRGVIAQRYAEQIEAMYQSQPPQPPAC